MGLRETLLGQGLEGIVFGGGRSALKRRNVIKGGAEEVEDATLVFLACLMAAATPEETRARVVFPFLLREWRGGYIS